MAQKRMFDKTITNSDDFLDLPDSSQVLYFHLSMNADDDGFVNNWKSIIRMTGTKEDDLRILIAKSFIIPFESGVIVIRHWRINNFLRKDRHIETKFQDELAMLQINDNQEYIWLTNGQPSIDKNRIDKNSILEETNNNKLLLAKKSFTAPTLEEVENYCKERNNNVDVKMFYDYYSSNDWKDKDNKKIKNWKQKVITWEKHKQENNYLSFKERKHLEEQRIMEEWVRKGDVSE